MVTKTKKPKLGDCYIVHGHFISDLILKNKRDEEWLLVHGIATGRHEIEGIRHDHCWLELGEMAYDNSNGGHLTLPKKMYYALGRIEQDSIYRYTADQVRDMIIKYKHWGPWEGEFVERKGK